MIFYLSCTGNTRWAAKAIAERTGEKLLSIPRLMREKTDTISLELTEGERVGFCFPVHGWRPPKLVRKFVSKLRIRTERHYVFALATAGDTIGETMLILQQDLAKQGVKLDATFSLIMPESYLGLPFFYLDSPGKEQCKKENAARSLNTFLDTIENRKPATSIVLGNWPKVNSRVLGSLFSKYLVTDRLFSVESKLCSKCGKCYSVCPVRNIVRNDGGKPVWKRDGTCIACFSCYHHCPQNAIQYGNLTKGKGQYFFEKHK